jgi:hypothetical protein
MTLGLEEREQAVLDECGRRIVVAEMRLREVRQQAADAEREVSVAMARLQGALGAVLQLRGLNPDGWRAQWSMEQGVVVSEVEGQAPRAPTVVDVNGHG